MRSDLYSRIVLTVIAIALIANALNPYVNPFTTVRAQGTFSGVQFGGASGLSFFDARTGEFWSYAWQRTGLLTLKQAGKVSRLGQPQIQLSVDKPE
jgi:hypothetical protein